MPRARWAVAACSIIVVASVGGVGTLACASADGTPMTPKRWRKAANAICEDRNRAQSKLVDEILGEIPADGQPSLEQMTEFVEELEPVVQTSIDDIDELRKPKALRSQIRKLLGLAQEDLDALVADPSIGLEGNPFTDTELQAERLGLESCA